MCTIDGIHCEINEPWSEQYRVDCDWYSHKLNTPALDYKLGIDLYSSHIVSVKGPFAAGANNDISVFRRFFAQEIPDGSRVVADKGYRGYPDKVTWPNNLDSQQVKWFKERALNRHESCNSRLKKYRILDSRFRHTIDQHKTVFEAICVLVQYQMELGKPLFDI